MSSPTLPLESSYRVARAASAPAAHPVALPPKRNAIVPLDTVLPPARAAAAKSPETKDENTLARRTLRVAQFAIFPLFVLAAWWTASALKILPANILPSPLAVVQTAQDLWVNGEIVSNVGVSLWRVARGAALGLVIGLTLGVALGFSPAVESWLGPTFRTLAQIPSIALIPLLMMVLGIDDSLKLFIMAKACVVPLTLVTAEGIRNIPKTYLEVGEVFRLSRWTLIRRVILPGALPPIFIGIRQGLAHVWVSLVAVEVLASAEGIGYLMTWGRLLFQLDVVLVCVAIIGFVGFALDFTVRKTEARLLRWRGTEA
jgi:sulfonate transport system permease protein